MGQYYKIVNLDKREYLNPHDFDDGLKLVEFGYSGGGAMAGLAALLADGNGEGAGDIKSDSPLIGSWAGDRIVIAGDYAELGKFFEDENTEKSGYSGKENLYGYAEAEFTNIGPKLIEGINKSEMKYDHLRGGETSEAEREFDEHEPASGPPNWSRFKERK